MYSPRTAMRRAAVGVALVCTALCGTADAANKPLPRLDLSEAVARIHIKDVLTGRFGSEYTEAVNRGRQISGCRQVLPSRVRCRASWGIGDAYFVGPITIWLSHETNGIGEDFVEWNYAYTIKRYDDYCIQVEHGKHCTKTYRVR